MTKTIFRIKWDDQIKLRPILEAFGSNPFTITSVAEKCPATTLTSGDIQRFNNSLYIVKQGMVIAEDSVYRHKITEWKLTGRTIERLEKTGGS